MEEMWEATRRLGDRDSDQKAILNLIEELDSETYTLDELYHEFPDETFPDMNSISFKERVDLSGQDGIEELFPGFPGRFRYAYELFRIRAEIDRKLGRPPFLS
jgi:hypothetical protein